MLKSLRGSMFCRAIDASIVFLLNCPDEHQHLESQSLRTTIKNSRYRNRKTSKSDGRVGKNAFRLPNAFRNRCPEPVDGSKAEVEKAPVSKKPPIGAEDLPPRILDLLRQKETGMTADEIFDALKESGVAFRGKRPVALVYSTLENHPELFLQGNNGAWMESKQNLN